MTGNTGDDTEATRQARLAAALRANLLKRKARDRQSSLPPTGDTPPPPVTGDES